MKPTIGRIVNFVAPDGSAAPAIIVRVWSDTCVNLRVFYDGTNQVPEGTSEWQTSRVQDESEKPQPASWHWPKRN